MPGPEIDLKRELYEAGNRLLRPPESVDELLALLDRVQHCLALVDQQPPVGMQDALCPSFKALVTDELLKHPDDDVKVGVTSCLTEISRITAPDVPYNDELMKEVFRLTISSFEGLVDNSSKSFGKRVMILDTMARVRSCAVLLDLDCDALIVEMFEKFYKCLREFHTGNVVSSMEGIMTLVIEELEEVPTDLLCTLLSVFKKENNVVLPVARSLGEKVVQNCAAKLKSSVLDAIKSLRISLVDYHQVVASLCQITTEYDMRSVQGNESEPVMKAVEEEAQAMETVMEASASLKSTNSNLTYSVSNGFTVQVEGHAAQELNPLHKPDPFVVEQTSENTQEKVQPLHDVLRVETATKPESLSISQSEPNSERIPKKRGRKPKIKPDGNKEFSKLPVTSVNIAMPNARPDDSSVEPTYLERMQDSGFRLSSPTPMEISVLALASPSLSDSSAGKTIRKKVGRPRKVKSTDENTSNQKAVTKTSDELTNQETRHLVSLENGAPDASKDASKSHWLVEVKREEGEGSDSEDISLKQSGTQLDAGNGTPSIKKRGRPRKDASTSVATVIKDGISSEGTSMKKTKRNFTPPEDGKEFGKELVGKKIRVWWPADKAYYTGVIQFFNSVTKKHKILYTDNETENLNLCKEKWKLVEGGLESKKEGAACDKNAGDASEIRQLKKQKTDSGSAGILDNSDIPPKKRRGRPPKIPLAASNSDCGAKYDKPVGESVARDSKPVGDTETGNLVKSADSISKGEDSPNTNAELKKSNSDMPEDIAALSNQDSRVGTGVHDTVAVRLDINETARPASDATPDTAAPKSVKSDVNETKEQNSGLSVGVKIEGMNPSSALEVKLKQKRKRRNFSSNSPSTQLNADTLIKRRRGRPSKQSLETSGGKPQDHSKAVGELKEESRSLHTSDTVRKISVEDSWGVGCSIPVSAEPMSSPHGVLSSNIAKPDPLATASGNENELPKNSSKSIPVDYKPSSSTGLKLKFKTSGSETQMPKEKSNTHTSPSSDQRNKDGSVKRPRGRPCKPKIEFPKPVCRSEINNKSSIALDDAAKFKVDIVPRFGASFGEGNGVTAKENYLNMFNKPPKSEEADVSSNLAVGTCLQSSNKYDICENVDLKLSLATGITAHVVREKFPESMAPVEVMTASKSEKPDMPGSSVMTASMSVEAEMPGSSKELHSESEKEKMDYLNDETMQKDRSMEVGGSGKVCGRNSYEVVGVGP